MLVGGRQFLLSKARLATQRGVNERRGMRWGWNLLLFTAAVLGGAHAQYCFTDVELPPVKGVCNATLPKTISLCSDSPEHADDAAKTIAEGFPETLDACQATINGMCAKFGLNASTVTACGCCNFFRFEKLSSCTRDGHCRGLETLKPCYANCRAVISSFCSPPIEEEEIRKICAKSAPIVSAKYHDYACLAPVIAEECTDEWATLMLNNMPPAVLIAIAVLAVAVVVSLVVDAAKVKKM